MGIIVIFILVLVLVLFLGDNGQDGVFPRKCPKLIDPQTNEPCDLSTTKGKSLFQKYLLFYLRDYLEQTKSDWNYVTPKQFREDSNKSRYFLLDVRKPKDYAEGHIANSINIFWLDLLEPDNINRLPRDREILIICYVGHTASQLLVMLKLLGFKAKVLKFGMGISPDPKVPIAGWSVNQK